MIIKPWIQIVLIIRKYDLHYIKDYCSDKNIIITCQRQRPGAVYVFAHHR